MARAALKWSLSDLARKAGVGRATVARFELGESETGADIIAKLRAALEANEVDFTRRAGRVGVTVPE